MSENASHCAVTGIGLNGSG